MSEFDFPTYPTTYFPSDGTPAEVTLTIAKKRADELGITNIVVASTGGATGLEAATLFQGYNLVVVSHATGLRAPDTQEMPAEKHAAIEALGAKVLTCQHAFSGIGGGGQAIANTLRCFSQGTKVACEIALMAADAGLLSTKEEAIAIAGSGKQADTALVIKPANSRNVFDLDIREVLCMPRAIEQRRASAPMIFGNGKFTYELVPDWPKWPDDWNVTCCTGAATDSQNRVYVLNRSEHPVGVFDAEGNFLSSFGEGLFGRAHGVFIDDEDIIYCSDDVDHVVMKFNTKGELIETIGTRGVPSDSGSDPNSGWPGWIDTVTHAGPPFNKPTRMVKSPKGEFWASDGYANAAVHHWDADGNLVKTFGGPGRESGHFRLPHGLDVDRLDRVWVADRENSRIQLFSNEGEFLREWPNRLRPAEVFAGQGDYVFVGEIDGRITVLDLDDNIVAEIGYPYSIIRAHSVWVDQVGDIYFATLSRGTGFYKLIKK